MMSLISIYAGAIFWKMLLDGTPLGMEMFTTVGSSMETLLVHCTMVNGFYIVPRVWDVHPVYGMLMLLSVVWSAAMRDLMSGLMFVTVNRVADLEKEEKTVKQLIGAMEDLWALVIASDANDDGSIDLDEFAGLISNKQTAKILQSLDVDVEGLASLASFVFEQSQGKLG